jgi:hypothetical protein
LHILIIAYNFSFASAENKNTQQVIDNDTFR